MKSDGLFDKACRERELGLEDRRLALQEADLELRRKQSRQSGWRSPIVVAVLAAAVAAAGNAVVTAVQGRHERDLARENAEAQEALEDRKAQTQAALEEHQRESSLILEAVRTGDPETALENLNFFIEAGLIRDETGKIGELAAANRAPTLPAPAATTTAMTTPSQGEQGGDLCVGGSLHSEAEVETATADLVIRTCELPLDPNSSFFVVSVSSTGTEPLPIELRPAEENPDRRSAIGTLGLMVPPQGSASWRRPGRIRAGGLSARFPYILQVGDDEHRIELYMPRSDA